jgi:hypothetical protein
MFEDTRFEFFCFLLCFRGGFYFTHGMYSIKCVLDNVSLVSLILIIVVSFALDLLASCCAYALIQSS